MLAPPVHRTGTILRPDCRRVLVRPFLLADSERVPRLLNRVLALSEAEVGASLAEVMTEFSGRHTEMQQVWARHFRQACRHLPAVPEVSPERLMLIGAYFTSEYALESAALFNPSIVPAPNQSGLEEGALRFVMSLRATGEGHISSIEFREGIVDAYGEVHLSGNIGRLVTEPEKIVEAVLEKKLFFRKLRELGLDDDFSRGVLFSLGDHFTRAELESSMPPEHPGHDAGRTRQGMILLAASNYETRFRENVALAERIIFPSSPSESNGIEDARFVAFREEDGSTVYYATYTAYDGRVILPQLLETSDFLHFKVRTLNGPAAQNKGMALFPRHIDGLYAMISRQDNENVFIMFSDHVHFWYEAEPLFQPRQHWELVQMGNCGSPIETEAGWLVLTHGVGPMRKYCIGAILLDLENPRRVIGRLHEPLLTPDENEREGYVPNVVYTCGALVHGGRLILPYAMSDSATGFATLPLADLLARLV